jgi:CHAT domain-containing protein
VAERQAENEALPVLHGVDQEVESIAHVATLHDITIVHRLSDSTTVAGTSAALQAANVVHLACHGLQDSDDATQSGFCLGDGRLTISQLMELKFDKAYLAFLSACETAKGDSQHPDQAMHLAAAMLFAGFKGVIATMW